MTIRSGWQWLGIVGQARRLSYCGQSMTPSLLFISQPSELISASRLCFWMVGRSSCKSGTHQEITVSSPSRKRTARTLMPASLFTISQIHCLSKTFTRSGSRRVNRHIPFPRSRRNHLRSTTWLETRAIWKKQTVKYGNRKVNRLKKHPRKFPLGAVGKPVPRMAPISTTCLQRL